MHKMKPFVMWDSHLPARRADVETFLGLEMVFRKPILQTVGTFGGRITFSVLPRNPPRAPTLESVVPALIFLQAAKFTRICCFNPHLKPLDRQ